MDELCSPYSGKPTLSNYCFGVIGFNALDSIFFILIIGIELFLHKPKMFSQPNQTVLGLNLMLILWDFLCLTLVLFYLPVDQVSFLEAFSLTIQVIQWVLIFKCYYSFYSPYDICKTSLISLKFFNAFRVFSVFYLFIQTFSVSPSEKQQKVIMWMKFFNLFLVSAFVYFTAKKKQLEIDSFLSEEAEDNSTNYEKAGIFSRLTMNWTYGLLKLGHTRPLETTDVDRIRNVDSAEVQQDQLTAHISEAYDHSEKNGLLKVIVKRYKLEILVIVLIGIFSSFLEFSTPIFVGLLEEYLASDEPIWKGVCLVLYLLFTKIFHCLVANQYDFIDRVFSLRVRAAMSCEIYNKLLRISATSISQSADDSLSYGKIVNLVQVDVESITSGIINLMNLIILPFTWGFGFYLIFVTIGWQGGISGTSIIIILMWLNILLARKMSAAQKALMEKKDVRMKACNELLSNIRIFKMYGWEEKLAESIYKAREEEMKKQTTVFIIQISNIFLSWGAQNYIAAGVIVTLALSGKTLTPTNVFAGLAVVRVVKNSLYLLPSIINSFIQTRISLTRIQDFLRSKDQMMYVSKSTDSESIILQNASFAWDAPKTSKDGEMQETKRILKDLTITVPRGQLVAVVGKFASGKSSFLQALVQNMILVTGDESSVIINGSVAYCSQETWILNKTLRDNILFYKDFDEDRYNEVLQVSMLNNDIDIFPGGDLTEIGERGINLSGGQKARVSIARAVYSKSDIYLFDDPLAALDQYVGKNLFEMCFLRFLKNKTRVLVTNNQQYLSHADRILVFKDGEIIQDGTFEELSAKSGYFLDEVMVEMKQAKLGEGPVESKEKKGGGKEKKLFDSEERAIGSVNISVYKTYLKYAGGGVVILIGVLAMLLWQVDRMYTDVYLADWTDQSSKEQKRNLTKNILIYTLGSVSINLFILLRASNTVCAGLRAAKMMFGQMMRSLLDASIPRFYDVNPMGRVLNRFSKDQNSVDSTVVNSANWALSQIFQVFMYICFCIYSVPLVVLTIPVTLYLAKKAQVFYLASSRELTRLESMSRSPIVQHFSETLSGLSTIRAFSYGSYFKNQYYSLFDKSSALSFSRTGTSCWLSIVLELISDIVLAASALIIVINRDNIDPGLAGACLTYVMLLPEGIYSAMFATTNLENAMVSVERIHNMRDIEREDPRVCAKDEQLISKSWPLHGKIEFVDYSTRYRPDTELVLRDVSFCIKGSEKIGVMGRTGSGKSSMVNALFRVIKAEKGAILIDGVDIAQIGLNLLRQKLCVIPQDPALFRGKLRDNIDPLQQFSDTQIENMLRLVKLDFDILFEVADGASNLSAGQKQLICIARALLRGSKIVILDEATASIDFKTDMIIQVLIKEEFKSCTVITIAHRVNTIMESDRILVLDNGKVAEFDSIENLRRMKGLFCKLSMHS